ncbi:CLUMA_CG007680, isoform A [Clunio marinus]|uniref:T-complex protein 1 subunit gamma n=1 Tax=Clunio marinus TaxID=568069 RepID=A0A1J1I314_9DIPT|nr:CLUMA_CG007680, isoform A [Clunio marinus]
MYGQQPILVLSQNTKRESGRKVQVENINAGKAIADLIRTCLGPQAMLKMLMDPMGGIVMTNDGNAILREITVTHPAAKSMIEIARTQDEEVGDGTTSVIVLAGEMLAVAEPFLQQQIHPTVIIRAYREALEDMINVLQNDVSIALDKSDKSKVAEVVKACVEEFVQRICEDIIAVKPDLVFTEKGVSDLAQHYLLKAGITAIRRLRKTDNLRVARACGATIVNRTEELTEKDVGTGCGLFEVRKLGDEYFTFITECKDPKACTILLRGASKDILNETERNLQDALHVARNLMLEPRLVPGGGAVEMAVSQALTHKQIQGPYRAVAQALEIIPRTLAQNCGANTIRTLTALRAKHASHPQGDTTPCSYGINGETGEIVDMKVQGIWEPLSVKMQVYKTAVETAILLLRIDDIVSGSKKRDRDGITAPGAAAAGQE